MGEIITDINLSETVSEFGAVIEDAFTRYQALGAVLKEQIGTIKDQVTELGLMEGAFALGDALQETSRLVDGFATAIEEVAEASDLPAPAWLGEMRTTVEGVTGVVDVAENGLQRLAAADLGVEAVGLSQVFGVVTEIADEFGGLPEKARVSMGQAVTVYQSTVGGLNVVGETLEGIAEKATSMDILPEGAKDSINQVVGVYQSVLGSVNQFDGALQGLSGQWTTAREGARTFAEGLERMGFISHASMLKTMALSAAQKTWALGSSLAVSAVRGVTAGIKMMNLAVLTSPIGLVIGGVAMAAGLLIAKWSKVGPFFAKIWQGIVGIVQKGIGFLKKLLEHSPLGLLFKGVNALGNLFSKETVGKVAAPAKKAAAATAMGAVLTAAPAAADLPRTQTTGDSQTQTMQALTLGAALSESAGATRPFPAPSADVESGLGAAMPPEMAVLAPSQPANLTVSAPITIHAAPGMNEQVIAEQVRLELEKAAIRAQSEQRGALHD